MSHLDKGRVVTVSQDTSNWQPSQREIDGQKAKTRAIVFGLIGFFGFAGVAFGALAIWQANKAMAAGVRAKFWLVLGIIDVVFSAIVVGITMRR